MSHPEPTFQTSKHSTSQNTHPPYSAIPLSLQSHNPLRFPTTHLSIAVTIIRVMAKEGGRSRVECGYEGCSVDRSVSLKFALEIILRRSTHETAGYTSTLTPHVRSGRSSDREKIGPSGKRIPCRSEPRPIIPPILDFGFEDSFW